MATSARRRQRKTKLVPKATDLCTSLEFGIFRTAISRTTGAKTPASFLLRSGYPLLGGSGNLVGVVSAKLDAMKMAMNSGNLPQNVNFAVESANLAIFLDSNRVAYKMAMAGKAVEPADSPTRRVR